VLLTAYTLTVRQVADGQEDPKVKQGARGLAGEGLRFLFGADPARVEITDGGLSIAPGETPGG